jgi:putative ATP-binding cassette transporter
LLIERLKDSTIVSIGHRSTLVAFHNRRLEFAREGGQFRTAESAVKPA